MTKYYIRHTDITKNPIEIEEGSINEVDFSIALFGRIRLEYGERLNQHMLNILENFAVGMDPNLIPPTPTPMPSFSPSAGPAPSVTPSIGSSPTPTPNTTPTPTPSMSVDSLNFNDIPSSITQNDAVPENPTAWYMLIFNNDGTGSLVKSEARPSEETFSWLNFGSSSDYELYYTPYYPDISENDPGPGKNIWHDLTSPITFYDETASSMSASLVITIRQKTNTSYGKTKTILISMLKS